MKVSTVGPTNSQEHATFLLVGLTLLTGRVSVVFVVFLSFRVICDSRFPDCLKNRTVAPGLRQAQDKRAQEPALVERHTQTTRLGLALSPESATVEVNSRSPLYR